MKIVHLPIYGGYAADDAYELIGSLGGTADANECCEMDACVGFCERRSAIECPVLLALG